MLKKILLSSFILMALSACDNVEVPDTTVCFVKGAMIAGAGCETTISNQSSDMTLEQFIDFLEPQPERPDPEHPGALLPARAGALCQSTDDWNANKTALEQACRILGRRCTYEIKKTIETMQAIGRLNGMRI